MILFPPSSLGIYFLESSRAWNYEDKRSTFALQRSAEETAAEYSQAWWVEIEIETSPPSSLGIYFPEASCAWDHVTWYCGLADGVNLSYATLTLAAVILSVASATKIGGASCCISTAGASHTSQNESSARATLDHRLALCGLWLLAVFAVPSNYRPKSKRSGRQQMFVVALVVSLLSTTLLTTAIAAKLTDHSCYTDLDKSSTSMDCYSKSLTGECAKQNLVTEKHANFCEPIRRKEDA